MGENKIHLDAKRGENEIGRGDLSPHPNPLPGGEREFSNDVSVVSFRSDIAIFPSPLRGEVPTRSVGRVRGDLGILSYPLETSKSQK